MIMFFSKFPELAQEETRWIIVPGQGDLPEVQFAFLESYCDDPGCDCQRVMISVISEQYPGKILATISYGWKSDEFYKKWGCCAGPGGSYKGPYLDLLKPQSKCASMFLDIFKNTVQQDQEYADRLQRHYEMIKKATA